MRRHSPQDLLAYKDILNLVVHRLHLPPLHLIHRHRRYLPPRLHLLVHLLLHRHRHHHHRLQQKIFKTFKQHRPRWDWVSSKNEEKYRGRTSARKRINFDNICEIRLQMDFQGTWRHIMALYKKIFFLPQNLKSFLQNKKGWEDCSSCICQRLYKYDLLPKYLRAAILYINRQSVWAFGIRNIIAQCS
jgi:hypothetical protein